MLTRLCLGLDDALAYARQSEEGRAGTKWIAWDWGCGWGYGGGWECGGCCRLEADKEAVEVDVDVVAVARGLSKAMTWLCWLWWL